MFNPAILTLTSLLLSLTRMTAPRDRTHTFVPTSYAVVPELFVQDAPYFNSTEYDPLDDSLGLIEKGASRWVHFAQRVRALNAAADEHTAYKVLYVARHGQGWHNVAESKYGHDAWDEKWSKLETDGEITWGPDAQLTPLGESQAARVNAFFRAQARDYIPVPQSFYSSPLSRAAQTLSITWDDIVLERTRTSPLVKEELRETIGVHTCDKRSDRSEIARAFPNFSFESGFAEHDELWTATEMESHDHQAVRTRRVLDQIFASDDSVYVSITAHSGTLNALFKVVDHQPMQVLPGGIVPIVVKAQRRDSEAEDRRPLRFARR